MHLDAHIDAPDVVLVPGEGGQYQGQLRVAIVGYTSAQLNQRSPVMPLDLHYSAQDREKALQQGIAYTQNLGIDPNITAIRLIVFDRGSSAIGSVTIPVPTLPPDQGN